MYTLFIGHTNKRLSDDSTACTCAFPDVALGSMRIQENESSRVESSRVDVEKKYVKMRQWKWEMPHVARVTVIRYMYDVALLSELLYMLLTIDNEGMI